MWDGTLSGEDFQFAAKKFLEVWNNHESNAYQWSWQECSHSSAQGYLILENVALRLISDEETDTEEDDVEEDKLPDAASLTDFTRRPSVCTYHVIYNESYRVPNIFFRGYHSDGRPMNWLDIQTSLPPPFAQHIEESKWTFLTQEEHPYLHRPWFMLHPCGTSSIMALIFSQRTKKFATDKINKEKEPKEKHNQTPTVLHSERDFDSAENYSPSIPDLSSGHVANVAGQYLLLWLSFVGPVLRLPIALDLFKSLK